MPRIARVVEIGMPHHITQRGNYRQKVFEKKEDFQKYISWINEYSEKYGLSILAYCLMTNHVHFIAIPDKKESMSLAFNMAHMRYAQYINKKKKACGHLWQGRFYSSILDEEHLLEAVRYVERNPVRANIVKKAWDWNWSSAGEHIGIGTSEIKLSENEFLKKVIKDKWKEYLACRDEEKYMKEIRRRTAMGRPFVGDRILKMLEDKFKMRLEALDPWRPKKKDKNK